MSKHPKMIIAVLAALGLQAAVTAGELNATLTPRADDPKTEEPAKDEPRKDEAPKEEPKQDEASK